MRVGVSIAFADWACTRPEAPPIEDDHPHQTEFETEFDIEGFEFMDELEQRDIIHQLIVDGGDCLIDGDFHWWSLD
jgi:hypothetical protein